MVSECGRELETTALTANQHKAIGWYASFYGYRMTLSTPPIIYFIDKDGNEVSANIDSIVGIHKGQTKEEAKQKRKEAKQNENNQSRQIRLS